MAAEAKLMTPKVISYALVRDKNGKVKVDDVNELHPVHRSMMTQAELDELGIEYTEEDRAIVARMHEDSENAKREHQLAQAGQSSDSQGAGEA